MCPFDVLVADVPDEALGGLLTALGGAGFAQPVITPARAVVSETGGTVADLVSSWERVDVRENESYRWPDYSESYPDYVVYRGRASQGQVHVALGYTTRKDKWGRDRRYIVAFLSAGSPVTPLVELLEADDYSETGDYLSVIRGLEGGRKLYGPSDPLPAVYASNFNTSLYTDRVDYPGVWRKMVVAINENDVDGMCNHALLQARRRGNI